MTATTDMISICAHKIGGPGQRRRADPARRRRARRGDPRRGTGARSSRRHRRRRRGRGTRAAVRLTMKELADVTERVLDLQEQLVAAVSLIPGCSGHRPRARCACPAPCTSRSTTWRATSCSSCWTKRASARRRPRAARAAPRAPATCWPRWASSHERARGSLRLSMGAETTDDDVDAVIAILSSVVYKLRGEA